MLFTLQSSKFAIQYLLKITEILRTLRAIIVDLNHPGY